jgi:UDP-2-acetamido-3-amino-2,3-dideoxy-glucuronate N-acetyltransferase
MKLIHPTSEVSESATVGAGTRIWQYCIIMAGARIGADCKLAHNVFVEGDVRIGDRVTVKDNVALYDGVLLEDEVFVGPNAVFTNVLVPRALISRKDEFQPTLVKFGASIGANATLLCGCTIGCHALVGAGSVVTRDVPDQALVVGNPANQIGWVSISGQRLGDDLMCPETGEHYVKGPNGLRPEIIGESKESSK